MYELDFKSTCNSSELDFKSTCNSSELDFKSMGKGQHQALNLEWKTNSKKH
jgi:hypothetical protein